MSRRRSRLPSTAIASSSIQILSVDEFLKGLHRTPRKSRNRPTQTTPSTATKVISPLDANQEDDFLLETLAALEKADEETAHTITKRKLREPITLGTGFPKKRRKKHHVAYNSLVLSRDPQNKRFLYSGEAEEEDSDPDPIVSGGTQTDNPVSILLKPRFPVSVIRESIVYPWSQRGRNLTAAGEKESRVIHRENESWGDRIDSLLVPGKVRAMTIQKGAPSSKEALELVNVVDRAETPTGANKFPHFISSDPQPTTPDCCSPSQDRGLASIELGPELGFFPAPQALPESKKPAVAVQPVSQHFKRICAINSTKLSQWTSKVPSENHTAEPPLSLRISKSDPNNWNQAEAQGSAMERLFPRVSPSVIGSDVTVEERKKDVSMAKILEYPWERFDRSPTPFPSPESGIAPRGSDCSSLLRFWESQLPSQSPDLGFSGSGVGVCISPMQEPESTPQSRAKGGTKKPSLIPDQEVGEGNSISSSAKLWEDYQLGHLELTSPPKQPPRVILESPKSMPRSDQLAQAQPEQVMLPPPFRHPRKLIDEYESEDDMDGINEISGGNYFSNAQKILNNPEDARLSIPSNRPNWNTKTIPAKVQLGSKNFHKSQPPIYSLSPLSTPTSIRTYSNVPLKEIIKRREIVPLRRPTISGSFKSPFLSKSPMTNMDQALVPSTSEFICQGQEHGTMPISNQSPFIIPTSIIPSTFAIEFDNKAKRCMTESEPFPLSTSTHASRIGPRRATQAAPLKAHRGMTIRFEASQKPFKPPLMTKPLKSILRTGRQASGFDTTDDSPILVNPRKKIITKARTKSGQEGLGEGAQCAGKRKVVTGSFAEVQAAW